MLVAVAVIVNETTGAFLHVEVEDHRCRHELGKPAAFLGGAAAAAAPALAGPAIVLHLLNRRSSGTWTKSPRFS